jgi:hypothetical protein
MQQQLQRRVVGPMQIVEQHHGRRLHRHALQVLEVGVEQHATLLIGGNDDRWGNVAIGPPQARDHRRDLGSRIAQGGAQRLRQQPCAVLGNLDERAVWRRPFLLVALAGQDQAASRPREPLCLTREPRFADARLTAEEDQTTVAEEHPIDRSRQLGKLGVARYERGPLLTNR